MNTERNDRSSNAVDWPSDVNLDEWYKRDRNEIESTIRNASNFDPWLLQTRRDKLQIYSHMNNKNSCVLAMRAVAIINSTVDNVMECLRSPSSRMFHTMQKQLHNKNFIDAEVLHSHFIEEEQVDEKQGRESICLKWAAYSSGKTLGRSKEFLYREYCNIYHDYNEMGDIGIVKFESYDGIGAKYGIRAKNADTYSLTIYEPSSIVVQQSQDDTRNVTVTLTFSMRKARGEPTISSGVKTLGLRMAMDLANIAQTVQNTPLQVTTTLVSKNDWVQSGTRSNCTLCLQAFGVLKRKHHCRACGDVVCSNCTTFKVMPIDGNEGSKVRVCKSCLNRSSGPRSSNDGAASNSSSRGSKGVEIDTVSSELVVPSNGNAPLHPGQSYQPNSSMTSSTTGSFRSSSNSDDSRSDEASDPVHNYSTDPADSLGPLPSMTTSSQRGAMMELSNKSSALLSNYHRKDGSSTINTRRIIRKQSLNPSLLSTNSSSTIPAPPQLIHSVSYEPTSSRGSKNSVTSEKPPPPPRVSSFNEDFDDICHLAMETLKCEMAGIRTPEFELVRYADLNVDPSAAGLPRSLPTFRRLANKGKPCIVLDVSTDKRISGEKRHSAKLQFFVGIPLIVNGEMIGDLCVASRKARQDIEQQHVEVLEVLVETLSQTMLSHEYAEGVAAIWQRKHSRSNGPRPQITRSSTGIPGSVSRLEEKEVAL